LGKTNLLQPGESQTITDIKSKDLASFVTDKNAWIGAGNYKVALDLLLSILKKQLYFH
jgi:hypothetical protein